MASANPAPEDVEIRYSSDLPLDTEALGRVRFDVESLSQVIRSTGESAPGQWLARPEGYQEDGHVLRDSEAIRLIAWSASSPVLYATDGCNSCRHVLDKPFGAMSEDELQALSNRTQIPRTMLGGADEG